MPYDYFTDRPKPGVGLLALERVIQRLRDTSETTILLDNGDFLQGTPMTDAVVARQDWEGIHPIIQAMNALGYDALTLGNHEFNFGLEFLRDAIGDFEGDVVSANIFRSDTDEPLVDPYVILPRQVTLDDGTAASIRIGLLGLAPPQITTWDASVVGDDIQTGDILEAARAVVPQMKAAGADIIVAMAHTGIGSDHGTAHQENAGVRLAEIDGIDALVLGHTHDRFPTRQISDHPAIDGPTGRLHGKPAIMPAAMGHGVGRLDLRLTKAGARWEVAGFDSALHVAEPTDEPMPFVELPAVRKAHQDTLDLIRTPIGETTTPLQSYFSMVSNCRIVQLINDAQRALVEDEIRNTECTDLPILSVTSPYKSGGHGGLYNYIDLSAGPLAICNAAEFYSFPNTLCAAVLSGAEIARWLERAASVFFQLEPGQGAQALFDPEFPSYDFDVFDGLTYQIDLSVPAMFGSDGPVLNGSTQRIRDMRHDGVLVQPDDQFVVATNNYRIGGGGGFFKPDPERVIADSKKATRDVLIDYIKAHSPLTVAATHTWSFTPITGAVGLFETGTRAPDVADDITDRQLGAFTRAPNGGVMGRLIMG